MDNFLNRLAPRPSDYGGLPGKITREDDAGNVYDESGRKIFNKFDQIEQPASWLDAAVSTATAPAKLATGLVGSLSPYGQDGWQVPPIISEPAAAFARSGESTGFGPDGQFYLPNVQNPQVSQDTLTQLMTVYGGNALNPLAKIPAGSVGMFAGRRAKTADADFDAFRPSERGAYGPGVYVTPDADYANRYAIGRSGWEQDTRIMPLHVRGDLADGLLYESLKREARASGVPDESIGSVVQQQLAEMGYTGVEGKANQAVTIFDPSNIRSVNAAFDPARAGENGLLLSDNKPSLLGSALASGQGGAAPASIRAYHGMDGPVVGDAFNGPSFWATDRPATASRYAEGLHRGQQFEATAPNVLPVDMTGKIYDATGLENKIGVFDVARKNAREAGADIIKHLGGNYEAINRGTVRSATTGETLFSDNRPSIFGSALASAQSEEDIIRLLGIR